MLPITALECVHARNAHGTFYHSATLICDHLHKMGYIHATTRASPLVQIGADLNRLGNWSDMIHVHKSMLCHDHVKFLLNAARQYVEIPGFMYENGFFSVPLHELVMMLNVTLTRYHLIDDAPDIHTRITGKNIDHKMLSRLTRLQSEYFNSKVEKYVDEDNEWDAIDYVDYDDLDNDYGLSVVNRSVMCGYHITSDVPPILETIDNMFESRFDFIGEKEDCQLSDQGIALFTIDVVQLAISDKRCYADKSLIQTLKEEVFAVTAPAITPNYDWSGTVAAPFAKQPDPRYADYLLSTPDCSRGIMRDTLDWTIVRQCNFFLAPKGAGKSTITKDLQSKRIGVFEDEHLMKLIPYSQNITNRNLEEWRLAISDRFMHLVVMCLARGDHVIWSLSNFSWFCDEYKWLRGIRTLILDVDVIFQHSNQNLRELKEKKQRDRALISRFMNHGFSSRPCRTLAAALNWTDTRTHDVWMRNESDDQCDFVQRFGEQ